MCVHFFFLEKKRKPIQGLYGPTRVEIAYQSHKHRYIFIS